MLLRTFLPPSALSAFLLLVRLHGCRALVLGGGFVLVEGRRVAALVRDALMDTRISVARAMGEA